MKTKRNLAYLRGKLRVIIERQDKKQNLVKNNLNPKDFLVIKNAALKIFLEWKVSKK